MFNRDWPYRIYLPVVSNNFIGPANHLLISEIFYDPLGDDDKEFIEMVNPTGAAIDLSAYSLSDAVIPADYEDLRRFPLGHNAPRQPALFIATNSHWLSG